MAPPAAFAGVATIAMPQVSRAQTVTWKYQSTWPTKDIFHDDAVDYAKKVNEMSGGRLKLDVLAAGAVVPAFQMSDAVHAGILDANEISRDDAERLIMQARVIAGWITEAELAKQSEPTEATEDQTA